MISVPGMAKDSDRSPITVGESDRLRVSKIRKPLAIAMWDYSWILRHHRYGEFENWNKVLEGLAEEDIMPSGSMQCPSLWQLILPVKQKRNSEVLRMDGSPLSGETTTQ